MADWSGFAQAGPLRVADGRPDTPALIRALFATGIHGHSCALTSCPFDMGAGARSRARMTGLLHSRRRYGGIVRKYQVFAADRTTIRIRSWGQVCAVFPFRRRFSPMDMQVIRRLGMGRQRFRNGAQQRGRK